MFYSPFAELQDQWRETIPVFRMGIAYRIFRLASADSYNQAILLQVNGVP